MLHGTRQGWQGSSPAPEPTSAAGPAGRAPHRHRLLARSACRRFPKRALPAANISSSSSRGSSGCSGGCAAPIDGAAAHPDAHQELVSSNHTRTQKQQLTTAASDGCCYAAVYIPAARTCNQSRAPARSPASRCRKRSTATSPARAGCSS